MTSYIVGCDNIDGKESEYKNYLAEKLQGANHQVEIISTGPSEVQNYGLSSNSTGKVGVQIVGGVCGWTASDMVTGVKNKYYHYDKCYIIGTSEFTGNQLMSTKGYHTYQMEKPHDAGNNFGIDMYQGKTPEEFSKEYNEYFEFCLADTFDKAIEMLLGKFGEEEEEEGSASTYKKILKELTNAWAGRVLIQSRGKELHVKKLHQPKDSDYGLAQEGVNIIDESMNYKDVNGNSYNVLHVQYGGNKYLTLKDPKEIERFGELKKDLAAVKYLSNPEATGEQEENTEEQAPSENVKSSQLTEVPIDNFDEALEFAVYEMYKIKSTNGRELSLEVLDEPQIQEGEWIKLNVPFFQEDRFMFVESIDIDTGSSLIISKLKLVDAPPVLAEEDVYEGEKTKEGDLQTFEEYMNPEEEKEDVKFN